MGDRPVLTRKVLVDIPHVDDVLKYLFCLFSTPFGYEGGSASVVSFFVLIPLVVGSTSLVRNSVEAAFIYERMFLCVSPLGMCMESEDYFKVTPKITDMLD